MHQAPERIKFDNAPREIAPLASALAAGGWELDLSGCTDFDSSLIGVLLEMERRAQAQGAHCRFVNPPPNLVELARLYGVRELLFAQ